MIIAAALTRTVAANSLMVCMVVWMLWLDVSPSCSIDNVVNGSKVDTVQFSKLSYFYGGLPDD
jgi:hypothetical protein